jgi:hypothetical protein
VPVEQITKSMLFKGQDCNFRLVLAAGFIGLSGEQPSYVSTIQ